MTGPRVLIVDDQELIRTGFRLILRTVSRLAHASR